MLPIKIGRFHEWFLYVVGGILTLSGALWVYFHYFIRIEGDFGPIHHPMERDLLSIHGISAALMMIGFGSVLPGHVSRAWSMRRNLWTGIFMFATMVILSASGYFLYYLGNESVRSVTAIVHWAIGLALPIIAVIHIQRGLKSRRK